MHVAGDNEDGTNECPISLLSSWLSACRRFTRYAGQLCRPKAINADLV